MCVERCTATYTMCWTFSGDKVQKELLVHSFHFVLQGIMRSSSSRSSSSNVSVYAPHYEEIVMQPIMRLPFKYTFQGCSSDFRFYQMLIVYSWQLAVFSVELLTPRIISLRTCAFRLSEQPRKHIKIVPKRSAGILFNKVNLAITSTLLLLAELRRTMRRSVTD
uniref:Uncharacterized protein n=1 Tax=Glossina pallidipes TaxID=7398 RepID=A0A1A9Z3H1_GLOPL